MSNGEFLLALFWKAAKKERDLAFVQYLYKQVRERIASGRSMDCDEYRSLHEIASK